MGFNAKSSPYYFHMKTKILADFQICVNVPLITVLVRNENLVKSGNLTEGKVPGRKGRNKATKPAYHAKKKKNLWIL